MVSDNYPVSNFPTTGDGYETDSGFCLPPLDVLMVWHAYMLNPRVYLEDSIRYTKQTLWRTSFPWELIYRSIDNATFDLSKEGAVHFHQTTQRQWDPLQDNSLKEINCPKCTTLNKVPWTRPPAKTTPEALEIYLINDTGYAGPAFEHSCSSCVFNITHEKLRVGKFCDDAHNVLDAERPLAGTILNMWGEPAGKVDNSRCI